MEITSPTLIEHVVFQDNPGLLSLIFCYDCVVVLQAFNIVTDVTAAELFRVLDGGCPLTQQPD